MRKPKKKTWNGAPRDALPTCRPGVIDHNGNWHMQYLLSWVSQQLSRARVCFAAVVHGVVNCLVPASQNKRRTHRNTLPYAMSNCNGPNLRDLHQIIQFIRVFITRNAIEILTEAASQILQMVYRSAMRELEKCVPLFFLFRLPTLL